MIKRIGITGGKGLIGKLLIKNLKKKKTNFTCFNKDIRDVAEIRKWLNRNKDIDIIFHLAAIVPLNKVDKYKNQAIAVNYMGTKNLYDSINKLDKKIWLFFSSTSHVYKSKKKPIKESDKIRPISFYGKTKLMAEKVLLKNKNKKIKICIGRIFSVFHKNQKKPYFYPSMIYKFKNQKKNTNKMLVLKGGNSIRDFSNAEQISQIIMKLGNKKVEGVFNIGSGEKITLLEFIKKYINNKIQIKGVGKSNILAANINKLKSLSI